MEELNDYVESKIGEASSATLRSLVFNYESQAFGAVEFYMQSHPEEEEEVSNKWANDWHPIFSHIAFMKD